MKKRVGSLLMAFVMVITLLGTTVPALAAGGTGLVIKADKKEAKPGDTITYTMTLNAVEDMRSLKFKLSIPKGLTYVKGSGKVPGGLADDMNAIAVDFTEQSMVFTFAGKTAYSSDKKTKLMTMKCKVQEGAPVKVALGLAKEAECFDNDGYGKPIPFRVTKATVSVKGVETTPVVPEKPEVKPVQPQPQPGGSELSFMDVAPGAYYYDAVKWAVDKNITGGKTKTQFAPNEGCTRAQAVTFLWRAAGSPTPKSTKNPFVDVPANAFYTKAVLWAKENGITGGTTATTFAPNATCTRAQIVTFLWRSQNKPAVTSRNPFVDVPANAYYLNAVLWAKDNGITGGTTATTFAPNATCTRGQIVTFLYRAR